MIFSKLQSNFTAEFQFPFEKIPQRPHPLIILRLTQHTVGLCAEHTGPKGEIKQDQKDLLNLPLCKVMNCYINCSHCEGQNLTEFQPSKMVVVVLPGLNLPQLQVEVIQ